MPALHPIIISGGRGAGSRAGPGAPREPPIVYPVPLLAQTLADGPPLQMVEADGEFSRQQLLAPPGEYNVSLIPAPPVEVMMLAPTHRKETHLALLLAA